ncbi:MAG: methyltransferase [Verrucomicrobiae bacterium]|nr:methyltransferase [Verrucomicrobiae bacterium]
MPSAAYTLVHLTNGAYAVQSLAYGEKMHPGLGPAVEAETLHVGQLQIRARLAQHCGEFVVWDVGLGAAANAIAVLRATRELPNPVRLLSFDDTAAPLAFARQHADQLGYFHGYESHVEMLLRQRRTSFFDHGHSVDWEFHVGDFPALLSHARAKAAGILLPPPHAILFDAFSPRKNPAMWTLPLFANLFQLLDPQRPCNLTTYSRSTMLRVTLLLAGFFVGRGVATGLKEETTVAANAFELVEAPLDGNWLERARRSSSAEPLRDAVYRQAPLSSATWEQLQAHPQFRRS